MQLFYFLGVYYNVSNKPSEKKRRQYTYEERKTAVDAVQNGSAVVEVVSVMGMTAQTIFRWLLWFAVGGYEALYDDPRSGRPRKITPEMAKWLYDAVTLGDPRQHQFPFCLWTLKTMRALLKKPLGVKVHVSTISRLLASMGLSAQRPQHQSYQRSQAKLQAYLAKYPGIKQRAAKEGAVIFFVDESTVRSDDHRGTTWSKRGKTPAVADTGDRFSIKLVSAISADGQMMFRLFQGRMKAIKFCEFLKKLAKDVGKKIIVICDNARYHTAKATKAFAENHGSIELEYLPPYCPELNPDEQVWNHLKQRLSKIMITSKTAMRKKTQSILQSIQKTKGLVKSFFKLEDTRYIIS